MAESMSAEDAVRAGFQNCATPTAQQALKNTDLIKFMAVQLEQTLQLIKDGGVPGLPTIGIAFSKKVLESSKLAQKATGNQGLKIANFAVDEMIQSLSLIKLANVTPGKALAVIGATFIKKTALAINIGATTKQQKCIGAWTDLAGCATSAVISGVGVPTGVGAVILVALVAQTIIAAMNTYNACID